ncbi:DUF421 domain-containing protein [Peptococcaceae bacterium 1198_IL3148]
MQELILFVLKALGVALIFLAVNLLLPRRTTGVFAGYDFVVMWLFGGLAAAPLVNENVPFVHALVSMLAVMICHFGISRLAVMNAKLSRLVSGQALLLVENGQVLRKNMRRAMIPSWMLLAELRCAGLSDVSQVEYAILETCGKISIIPKSHFWPVTSGDLGQQLTPVAVPSLLIEDGQILKDNLARLNYDVHWLRQELYKQGVARLEDVYLASVDGHGNLCFSYKE